MVKESLKALLDKFPYFLDKNEGSNFYKVQNVTNESLKLLYNDLFQVYDSFYLNKRLFIYREQVENYNYNINFAANYPNMKTVKIYKNNNLIYMDEYSEEDNIGHFEFTYTAKYVKENIKQTNVFICNECGEIYFDDEAPTTCTKCNSNNFKQLNTYKCNNCEEICFAEQTPTQNCNNCNSNNYTQINTYKCSTCGQIFFGLEAPDHCPGCNATGFDDINTILYYNDEELVLYDNADPDLDETLPEDDEDYTPKYQTGAPLQVVLPEADNESFTNPAIETPDTDNNTKFLIPLPIIPDDTFLLIIETYDEYTIRKGYPETDITYDEYKLTRPKHTSYTHDYSLDEYGALNNIPRKEYIQVDNTLYGLTEPPYNNNSTEDDYYYMKRIIEYNLRLWDTPAPVLEIWKLYGLDATLINRERLLIKMFDITKHEYDEKTGLVECWYPEPWEHKDKFCDGSKSLGEYFFVTVDTIRPTIYQNVNITFKILNSLAEEIIDSDLLVDIYCYVEEEGVETKRELKLNHDSLTAEISYKVFDTERTNVLRFEAHNSDGTSIGVEEILINVRNCDDGDWYVSPTGNDETGDGSSNKPFKTLNKALTVVNKALDLIVVNGDLILNDSDSIPIINTTCTILGCNNSSITSNYNRQFAHLVGERNITLQLVNLTLKNDEISSKISIAKYTNNNPNFYNYETILIHGGEPKIISNLNKESYYPFDFINITGSLKTHEDNNIPNKELVISYDDTTLGTINTDNNGEYNSWFNLNTVYDTDEHIIGVTLDNPNYFVKTEETSILLIEPTQIYTQYGSTITLTSTDYNNGDVVKFKKTNGEIIETVTVGSDGKASINWQPEWGEYTVYVQYTDNPSVKNEWFVKTYLDIDSLTEKEFITSVEFNNNGEFKADTRVISKLRDLDGIITNIIFNDDLTYTVEKVELDFDSYTTEQLDGSELTPTEYNILKECVNNIIVDDNGNITLQRSDI